MAGIITFKTSIIKGGVEKFALKQPIFLVGFLLFYLLPDFPLQPSPIDPMYSSKVSRRFFLPCSLKMSQLVFEGISVDYR